MRNKANHTILLELHKTLDSRESRRLPASNHFHPLLTLLNLHNLITASDITHDKTDGSFMFLVDYFRAFLLNRTGHHGMNQRSRKDTVGSVSLAMVLPQIPAAVLNSF